MQKCRFDKKSNFLRAYALYLKFCKNREAYTPNEQFLNNLAAAFDNPEDAAKAVEEHLVRGIKDSRTGSSIPVTSVDLVGNYHRNEDNENVASYYIGSSGYTRMVSKFRKDILNTSILQIDDDGNFTFIDSEEIKDSHLNVNTLQYNILKYKERLINDLCEALHMPTVSLDTNVDDNSFTNFVSATLSEFETRLLTEDSDKQVLEANGYYDSYVILKNFDRLIDQHTSYIAVDRSYRNNRWEGVKKYTLKPKVEHYSGFSKDEGADILKQLSDLAETVLRVIPEVDQNGNNIKNSVVGVSGFTGSMTTLKTALLYSDSVGKNAKDFRNASSKGLESLVYGNEFNLQSLIDAFIRNNTNKDVGTTSAFGQFRQIYIHNKLRGISKFLFSDKTPNYIKAMFGQMFIKTEATGYRAYEMDYEANQFVGKDLRSVMVMSQKKAFENVITSGISLIRNGSRASARAILDKYDIVITPNENKSSETLYIRNKQTDQELSISYTPDKKGLIDNGLILSDSEDIVRDVMRDLYSYLIPDTYSTCISENNTYRWENDFAPFIIIAAKEINDKLGLNSGATISLSGPWKEIDLSSLNPKLLAIARRLGVIYGDSIHNTVRNLSGNNLPLFQLTCLEHNWKSLLDDAKAANDGRNPLFGTLLWDNEDLLGAPQRRSEVQLNGRTKSSSNLSKKELLKVAIVDDFLTPFITSEDGLEDKLYFQNDTFSDKSTQFLITAYLNKKLDGKIIKEVFGDNATLKSIIKDAFENGTSKIEEVTRLNLRNRFTIIANNILEDYAAVFPEWGIQYNFFASSKDEEAELYYKELVKLDNILKEKNYSIAELRAKFKGKRDFSDEVHAYSPKNGSLGKTRINETFLAFLHDSFDKNSWKERIARYKSLFAESMRSVKLTGFTPGMDKQIDYIMKNVQLGKKASNASIESTHNSFYNPITREYKFISNDGELNPIAEIYFAIDNLLTNSFNQLTTGDFFVHTNKNKSGNTQLVSGKDIYTKLGKTTKTPNIIITSWSNLKNAQSPFDSEGSIISTRINKNNIESFGNTFTPREDLVRDGMTLVPDTKSAVIAYIDAVLYSNDPHYVWIRNQCRSGALKGRKILYYSELDEPSHATALDYLINKFNWSAYNGTITEYDVFSEANRFVNKIKRNVIYGSTIHPFAQGVRNEDGYDVGVTPTIDIAVIDHFRGPFYTINGVNSRDFDAQDGCGWCTMIQSIFENNSLVDAKGGDNKKTILHDIDHRYGRSTLLKWAVYALSNSVRRMGVESNAGVENLVRKMYSNPNKRFNFSEDIGKDYQDFRAKNGSIYVYNPRTCGEPKEIKNVAKIYNQELGRFDYIVNYGDGTSSKPMPINSLWDIDQLFGGAFTYTKNEDGSFTGTEASQYLLANIAAKYGLKDKQIAYAVSDSGCKVGATNMNPSSAWSDDITDLNSYSVSTKYAGMMMDADHELDMAQVTEMSQMISSLCEDGHYTDLVNSVYEEIGNIAFNNAKVQKYIKAIDKNDQETLRRLVGKSLIESFQTGNKDVIGLAQAFIKKADTEIRKAKIKGVDSNFTIPYSDPTIFGAFVADVISRFNKDAIRRKWDGFAGILNPSHDMVMYYRTPEGLVKMFKEFNEECFEKLGGQYDGILPDEYRNWVELAKTDLNPETNPFIVPISNRDIELEDTIVLNGKVIYIDDQTKLDRYRNYEDYTGIQLYKHTAYPRNLLGTRVDFTANCVDEYGQVRPFGKFSLYDIDSVRVSNYIANGIEDDDPHKEQKQRLIIKVLEDPSRFKNKEEMLAYCLTKTQEFLKALDTKVELPHQECFGDPSITSGYSFYADSYEVKPGEIIIGRYQLQKLGITDQDHLWQVTGPEWFLSKLRGQYEIPRLNVDEQTNKKTYDRVLYHNGVPFLIKVGNVTHGDDGIKEKACNQSNIVGDDLRFETEVILSNESDDENHLDDFKFSTIETGDAKYYLITVKTKEELDELTESPFFDDFYRNNHYQDTKNRNSGYSEDKRLQRIAEDRWQAFQKVLEFVGARIPTQSMQSYMPNNVIAVTDSKLNAVYASKASLAITGGDFDGDKYFLLACAISNNGTIQSGSALQKLLGYNTCIKLLRPNRIKYKEGENGTILDVANISQFNYDTDTWDEETKNNFVEIVNTIIKNTNNDSERNTITFIDSSMDTTPEHITMAEEVKNNFLKLLNRHTLTKSYISDSLDVLKNRGFAAIRRITLAAQNQIKANISVDSCTEPLKEFAANTTGGKAEKYISPFIPSSRFEMQEQGILGKEVVGIGAVSLKSYFMLENMFNNKIEQLKMAVLNLDLGKALDIAKDLIIYNPITDSKVTLANANFDPLFDNKEELLNNIANLGFDVAPWQNLFNELELAKANTYGNAPEHLSAVVSLAADNMKDLALPKLNATSSLVDLYTTAAMIGTPFEKIADIMTSRVFDFLNKYAAEDIFDSSTYFNTINNVIKAFNDPSSSRRTKDVLLAYERVAEIPEGFKFAEDWYNDKELVQKIVDKFVEPKSGIIEKTALRLDHSEEAEEARAEAAQEAADQGLTLREEQLKADMYDLYKHAFFLLDRLNYRNPADIKNMSNLQTLIDYADEVQLLGQFGSINQGLKTDLADFYNFGKNPEVFIKGRDNKDNFSFRDFLKDPLYRNYRIQLYNGSRGEKNGVFKCFNVLEALAYSPNFFSMSKLYPYAEDALKTSFIFKGAKYISDILMSDPKLKLKRINEYEMKEIVRYIQDLNIINYLKQSSFRLNLDSVMSELNSGIEIYQNYGALQRTSLHELALNTPMNMATFKHIMEAQIIPELKRRYTQNSFVAELLLQENPRTKITAYALPIPMMNIDKDESLLVRYTNYLRDFNLLAKDSFAGVNTGSLFFLYNLVVNKNQFGNQSFTRIFEDLVNTRSLPKEVSEYYNYISFNDSSGNIDTNSILESEVKYRIGKYVGKASRIESPISTTETQLPVDLAFDLPYTLDFYTVTGDQENDQRLFRWVPSGLIRADEVIETLANSLNNKRIVTKIITDEDVKEQNLPKEKAFIQDGIVYINSSYFTEAGPAIAVGGHEIAHLIIAAIKQIDPTDKKKAPLREAFYNLVSRAAEDKDFNEIAKLYPDRVGSDLAEEVICNKIEKLLLNQVNTNSGLEVGIMENKLIIGGLSNLLNYEDTDSLQPTADLDYLVQNFAKDMFNFENEIMKDRITSSQKLAELKTRLLKSDKDNYRLDQICK